MLRLARNYVQPESAEYPRFDRFLMKTCINLCFQGLEFLAYVQQALYFVLLKRKLITPCRRNR